MPTLIKNSLFAPLLLVAASTVFAKVPPPEVLSASHANIAEGIITLTGDPERHRIAAPPAVLLHLDNDLGKGGHGGFEVHVDGDGKGDLELQAIFEGKLPVLVPRRSKPANGPGIVRWELPVAERVTSATLTLRGEGTARIADWRMADFGELAPTDRIAALSGEPLRAVRAAKPVANGKLELELTVPQSARFFITTARLRLEWKFDNGTVLESSFDSVSSPTGARTDIVRLQIAIPDNPETVRSARLLAALDSEVAEIAALKLDLSEFAGPSYEVAGRSIEDFAVIERNGELAIYSCVSADGVSRRQDQLPVQTASVWLAVGNGAEWAVDEELLRIPPGGGEAGGPMAISAGRIDNRFHGFYTLPYLDGREGLGISSATSSLRLVASTKNPVWVPQASAGGTLWRGNAFLELNGSMMLVGIERPVGASPRARALSSMLQTRWTDLGLLPLPALPPQVEWITGFQDEGMNYLLAGPHAMLYRSEDLLRGWTGAPFPSPEGAEKSQLLRWDNRLWLFWQVRRNGRGIVSWAEVEEVDDSFKVYADKPFRAPALQASDEVRPTPIPLEGTHGRK